MGGPPVVGPVAALSRIEGGDVTGGSQPVLRSGARPNWEQSRAAEIVCLLVFLGGSRTNERSLF